MSLKIWILDEIEIYWKLVAKRCCRVISYVSYLRVSEKESAKFSNWLPKQTWSVQILTNLQICTENFALSVQIGTILQICTENLKFSTDLLNLRDLYGKFEILLKTCKTYQNFEFSVQICKFFKIFTKLVCLGESIIFFQICCLIKSARLEIC